MHWLWYKLLINDLKQNAYKQTTTTKIATIRNI
jgi:hypothetical protein